MRAPPARWVAVALGLAAAACGGGAGSPADSDGAGGGGDGAPGSGADARTTADTDAGAPADAGLPTDRFPLQVAAAGTYLETAAGAPFLIRGEAAWSLLVQLDAAEATQYLDDRRDRGVHVLLVNLIEHQFADDPPRNAAGDEPFTTPGDFSTPNPDYFAHADAVIDLAAERGIAVFLFPAYLGYGGGSEGWFAELSAQPDDACRAYGDFVGARYASRANVVWVWGGDYTPPVGSDGERCHRLIADRIRAAAPGALATGHWSPETTSLAEPTFADDIDLVGVYTYGDVLGACRAARAATPARPTYLLETTYENEHGAGTPELRGRQWFGALGCGAGEISGNNPIWLFGAGWPDQLGSPLSIASARAAEILRARSWWAYAPDDALVTGLGDSVTVGRTGDRTRALLYVADDLAEPALGLDLDRMAGPVTVRWLDPTADAAIDFASGLSGQVEIALPGPNAAGDGDWVLDLTVP